MTFSLEAREQQLREESQRVVPSAASGVLALLTAGYGLGKQACTVIQGLSERHQLHSRVATVRTTALTGTYTKPAEEAVVAPPAIPQWSQLLDACEDYAVLQGWRFDQDHFMSLDQAEAEQARAARVKAMPVALTYADRLKTTDDASPLLAELRLCEQFVAIEAVHNTMVSTCKVRAARCRVRRSPSPQSLCRRSGDGVTRLRQGRRGSVALLTTLAPQRHG